MTSLGSVVGLEKERVYHVHDWAEVHRLFHREGWAKTRIADEFWMSRNTVTSCWSCLSFPGMNGPHGFELDPHKGLLARMLDVDELESYLQWWDATGRSTGQTDAQRATSR